MKCKKPFMLIFLIALFAQSHVSYAQLHSNSTLRYPVASRTGNYILAWPRDSVVYIDNGSEDYSTSSRLEELRPNGTWGAPTSGTRGSNSYIIQGKAPGVYKYRLVRIVETESCTVDIGGEDDCDEDEDFYPEPAVEVVVVGNSQ